MKGQDIVISMSTAECSICLSELFPGTENEFTLSCECQFCRHCLKRYVEEKISNGMVDITCLSYSCDASLTNEELQEISDISIFERYLILNTNRQILLDSTRTWCPLPDCNTVCDIQDATSVEGHSRYHKYAQCPTCQHEFFPDEIENELMAWKIQELSPNTRMCPKCNILIERNGGCKEVLCRYCLTMVNVEKSKIVTSPIYVLFQSLVMIIGIVLALISLKDFINLLLDSSLIQNDMWIVGAVLMCIVIVSGVSYLVIELYYHSYAIAFWNFIRRRYQ